MGGSCSKCCECWAVCLWAKILTPETDCQHCADIGECKQASAGSNDPFGLGEYAGLTIPDILSNATKVEEISAYVNENFWATKHHDTLGARSDSKLLSSTTPNMDGVLSSMRFDTMCEIGILFLVAAIIIILYRLGCFYLDKSRAPRFLEYGVVYLADGSSRHTLPVSVERLEK